MREKRNAVTLRVNGSYFLAENRLRKRVSYFNKRAYVFLFKITMSNLSKVRIQIIDSALIVLKGVDRKRA